MGLHHSVIDLLMHRLESTGMVDEHTRSDMLRKTTQREDKRIARCAR